MHLSYLKTPQIGDVFHSIKKLYKFDNLPTIEFVGTTKLHGTNGSFKYDDVNGLVTQSRNRIITPIDDNDGFARFIHDNKDSAMDIITKYIAKYNIDTKTHTVTVYGEWTGCFSNVAIGKIPKSFFIFAVRISSIDDMLDSRYVECGTYSIDDKRFFNINNFKKFKVTIDFSNPDSGMETINEMVEGVEKCCPVANSFTIDGENVVGLGEGIVFKAIHNGVFHIFKAKGEKHAKGSVKKFTPIEIDIVKINSIKEFIEYSVTESRLNQALFDVCNNVFRPKLLGDVIRWVIKDITIEEVNAMTENNLTSKDVNRYISSKVRDHFMNTYNKQ